MNPKNNRKTSHPQSSTGQEREGVKIKSSVVSPPEPTPHPKDYESIEY